MRLTAEERRSISKVDSWIASGGGQAPLPDDVQPRPARAGSGVSLETLGTGVETPTRRVPSSSLTMVATPTLPPSSNMPTRGRLNQQDKRAGAKRLRAEMPPSASTPSAFSAVDDSKTSEHKGNVKTNGAPSAGNLQAIQAGQLEVQVEAQRALTVFFDGLSSFWHNANEDALDLTKNAICGAVSNSTIAAKPCRWVGGLVMSCLGTSPRG